MKRKTLKTRMLPLLLFFAALLTCLAHAAESELLFYEGFEHWQVSVSQDDDVMRYSITCPEVNLPVDKLQDYTLHIMSYCREKNPTPSSVTITFPYKGVEFSRMASEVQAAVSVAGGIRAVGSSFLNLSSCKLRRDDEGVSAVILTLDVNNPNSGSVYATDVPFGASLDAVQSLAARIQAQSSDLREQLRLLNEYLIKNVIYGEGNGLKRACSPVGTLLDGEAVCSGYSSTVSDVCYLLGIPSYQLYDHPNSHIWNVVFLDGRWLMLDTTANDTGGVAERFFLQPDFHDEYHSYDDAAKAQLAALVRKLNEAGLAAQRLGEAGIIQGDDTGDFALAEVLTYEALAVILTRLDGAEASVKASGASYSVLAKNSGGQSWALPYIGYCIEQGYFESSIYMDEDNRVTTTATMQMMAVAGIPQREVSSTGEYLLRGELFCMIDDRER